MLPFKETARFPTPPHRNSLVTILALSRIPVLLCPYWGSLKLKQIAHPSTRAVVRALGSLARRACRTAVWNECMAPRPALCLVPCPPSPALQEEGDRALGGNRRIIQAHPALSSSLPSTPALAQETGRRDIRRWKQPLCDATLVPNLGSCYSQALPRASVSL